MNKTSLVIAMGLAASAAPEGLVIGAGDLKRPDFKLEPDSFGSRRERRERRKGKSQCSGHTYHSKEKRKRKMAKKSRQYNRRKERGMRV